MTNTSKEAVERLMDGVTPGPWSAHRDEMHFDTLSDVHGGATRDCSGISRQIMVSVGGFSELKEQEANTRFIAAAREMVPALAAERDAHATRADAAEAEVARLTAELTALRAGQDALVAATVEAAADTFARHRSIRMSNWAYHMSWRHDVYNSIRNLTPAAATAAMDAKLRAERNKVLREAVAWCDQFIIPVGVPVTKITDMQMGRHDAAGQINAAILAMIEPEWK